MKGFEQRHAMSLVFLEIALAAIHANGWRAAVLLRDDEVNKGRCKVSGRWGQIHDY